MINNKYYATEDPDFISLDEPVRPLEILQNGWTAKIANVFRGLEVVQKIVDWFGGYGDKPAVNVYLGALGLVTDIALATNIKGVKGIDGWTPVFSIISDVERRVLKVVDWTGGEGTKPQINVYVGVSGFTTVLANAIDLRGQQGLSEADIIDLVVTTGIAFNSTAIVNGGTLPNLTIPGWIFVGVGTFAKPGGGTITTTAPINILSTNGTSWILNQAITIDLSNYPTKSDINKIGVIFDGTASSLKISPKTTLFPNANDWTFVFHLNLKDVVSTQCLFEGGENNPEFAITGGGLRITKSGVSESVRVTGIGDFLNQDILLSISFDGTDYIVKINNVSQAVTPQGGVGNQYGGSLQQAFIASYDGTDLNLNCNIYGFKLYDKVLSDLELTNIYNEGVSQLTAVVKDDIVLELHPDNLFPTKWIDSSINEIIVIPTGSAKVLTNNVTPKEYLEKTSLQDVGISFETDGFAKLTPVTTLFPNIEWSIEFLIKVSESATLQNIFNAGIGNPEMIFLNNKLYISKSGVAASRYFDFTPYDGQQVFVTVVYNGTNHIVYINGIPITSVAMTEQDYETNVISDVYIGSSAGTDQFLNGDLLLIRVYNEALSQDAITADYNGNFPLLVRKRDKSNITLELHGENTNNTNWYDSSYNRLVGTLTGTVKPFSIFPNLNQVNEFSYLDTIPSKIYVATGREFNLNYESFIPYYGEEVRVNVTCSKGSCSEREFRYTPTVIETNPAIITIKDLKGNIIESKTISLIAVLKTTGSGIKQSLFIGDSTTDSYITDYLGTGRAKYEMLLEFNNLVTTDGGITHRFLGTNGIAPILHEGRSGWSTNMFLNSGSPFWDGTRINFKSWMANNANFGGTDTINTVFIQLGINDLKYSSDPINPINNLKTLISKINDVVYGYPTAKIILSQTPYACADRTGWATAFIGPNDSDYESYIRRMLKYAELIVTNFHENEDYPNVYVAPNFLWVDRYYGFPREMQPVSSRCTTQIEKFTDSVHPDTSGYKQAADSFYSRFRSIL